ncbi:MAG: PglZ domain-containing protein [Flavobacteriales bacterium]|nr:PglZ domain-containing protein [Flavobacteriales bacterium]
MEQMRILWVDDEIELLKPHILFLERKGYEMKTANNGEDALEMMGNEAFDIVFLDENMPGISGLETLSRMTENHKGPVVMITKSEEEYIMEEALGSKISDYLIKPVNPNQILLSIKKNLDSKRLVNDKVTSNYQKEFREISMSLMDVRNLKEWTEIYQKLVYWELELDKIDASGMVEILEMQKSEANSLFFKYVKSNYKSWLVASDDKPVLSHTLLREKVFPHLSETKPSFFILIDNLRYDQWKVLEPILSEWFKIEEESTFCSILPTATQYSRNSIFSGLTPLELSKRFPHLWKNDHEEGGKNLHEQEFLKDQMQRLGLGAKKVAYHKVVQQQYGVKLVEQFNQLVQNDFNVIVYNFVDMLSHAKTEMDMIRELAGTDKSYRDLTRTWFENSSLLEMLKKIADYDADLIISTDHGTINVGVPSKVVGDRETSSNLRYKTGKRLQYQAKDVMAIENPEEYFLPAANLTSSFIFARENIFLTYPNNYNHFVKYFKNTYQHGGLSLEEMICPVIRLSAK